MECTSAELLISGNMLVGIPKALQVSSDQRHVLRSISIVRAAFVGSVT